jgi:hypothetical protein
MVVRPAPDFASVALLPAADDGIREKDIWTVAAGAWVEAPVEAEAPDDAVPGIEATEVPAVIARA